MRPHQLWTVKMTPAGHFGVWGTGVGLGAGAVQESSRSGPSSPPHPCMKGFGDYGGVGHGPGSGEGATVTQVWVLNLPVPELVSSEMGFLAPLSGACRVKSHVHYPPMVLFGAGMGGHCQRRLKNECLQGTPLWASLRAGGCYDNRKVVTTLVLFCF